MELRVLAIDDSMTVLELISTALSGKGHEVKTAATGKDGLAEYEKFKPDVVTLDLAMPGMDGYETFASLKNLDRYANVIIITAANHSSALRRCLDEGALDFISKPFRPADIVNAVERAMKNRKYCNRDAVVFFSRLHKELRNAVRDAFTPDSSTELKNVQTIRNVSVTQSRNETTQAPDYFPSEHDVCFITRITGEKDGMVMSLLKGGDLQFLFNLEDIEKSKAPDKAKEFFNMVNMKVVSELADSTQSDIDGGVAAFFSSPDRMITFWNETARMWDRIELGMFEVRYAGRTIPLVIQIWCDGELFT